MKFFSILLFLFSVSALAQTPQSYLVKQSILVPPSECGAWLDELSSVLIGENSEDQDLALVYRLSCNQDLLAWEALYESADQGRVEQKVNELRGQVFHGQALTVKAVMAVFFSQYHFQLRQEPDQSWSTLYGFEIPKWGKNFLQVWEDKEKTKSILAEADLASYLDLVRNKLSPAEWSNWLTNFWPQTELVRVEFHTYFLLEDSTVEKSGVLYQLDRLKN